MKKKTVSVCIIITALLLAGCPKGGMRRDIKPLENVEAENEGVYTCEFDGTEHEFITYLPDKTDGAPLILMLHGYGESAEAFCHNVHMEEKANPEGYAVVYVTGAPDPGDPTSATGWNSGIKDGGNDDVGFLSALAVYLSSEYGLDEKRIYAAGFSNGAFMAHRLAMEAPDVFSAVASVAGKMTESVWNARNERNDVGVLQITGEKDNVIPKNSDGSAKYANDPAIEDVMEYWAASNGLDRSEKTDVGKNSVMTKYCSESKKKQVWSVDITNGRHSWPDEKLTGIDTNSLILDFFEECSE